MSENEKIIREKQEEILARFGDVSHLYHYLFETMDNFYHRYLETTTDLNLKTRELGEHLWGAVSFEPSMLEALKNKASPAHAGILEMAKRIPKAENPKVRYGLFAKVDELTPEHGKLTIVSEIHWGFPEFSDQKQRVKKEVVFEYEDIAQFRKELALRLEEACELFL